MYRTNNPYYALLKESGVLVLWFAISTVFTLCIGYIVLPMDDLALAEENNDNIFDVAVEPAIVEEEPTTSSSQGFTNDYLFEGKELDEELGVYYFGSRYYDPEIGRFLSPDPAVMALGDPQLLQEITGMTQQEFLSDPQRLNAYSFARNNPLRYVDPTGNFNIETGQIEQGDTLHEITGQINGIYGTDYAYQDVAKLNSIENPDLIFVGQIIKPNDKSPDVTIDLTDKMHENAWNIRIQDPFYFKEKVQSGGDWDFKSQPGLYCTQESCGGKNHDGYVFAGEEIRYDAPGNIHYGYVGSNTWYGRPSVLHYFAGRAQNMDNNTNTGDDPSDIHYIDMGIDLYLHGH